MVFKHVVHRHVPFVAKEQGLVAVAHLKWVRASASNGGHLPKGVESSVMKGRRAVAKSVVMSHFGH